MSNPSKKNKKNNNENETITITFGDVCENHVRNQQIGELASCGYSMKDLVRAQRYFKRQYKAETELWRLNDWMTEEYDNEDTEDAYLLIIRKGMQHILGNNNLFEEMKALNWDKKAKMYGQVRNKHARYNLCFDEKSQNPNYKDGEGRVIAWEDVPQLKKVRDKLMEVVEKGEKEKKEKKEKGGLKAEGNYYFDNRKCGIGWHGDAERRKVIGVRLGASLNLCYRWYYKSKPDGDKVEFMLNHGDIYIMSEKAVGFDWKKKKIFTLRHSVGGDSYTGEKKEKGKKKVSFPDLS